MPAWIRLLCAGALLAAAPARATTVLVPDFVDDDPSEASKTRLTVLKAAGAIQGLAIAPLSKFKKLAKANKLDPKQLGNGPAAKILCRVGKLDGLLGGTVEDLDSKRTLHLILYGPTGKVLFKRDADLNEGDLRQDQLDRLTRGIAAALNLDDQPIRKTVVAAAPAKDTSSKESDDSDVDDVIPDHEPVKAKPKKAAPAAEVPEIDEERDEREAEERRHPKRHSDDDAEPAPRHHAPTSDEQRRLERFEDPSFAVEIGATGSSTNAQLYNDETTSAVSNLASGFYPGFVARLQTFPFHDQLNPLAGLGAQAAFSYGQVNVATATGSSFSASDIRFSGILNYRFRFPIDGDAAIFVPSIGPRIGFQLADLNPPANNAANVYPLDRAAFTLGGELVEPFGHYARLIVGGQYLFSPYPGSTSDPNAIEAKLNATQVYSLGWDLDAELQGHFGAPNEQALTAAIRFSYTQYSDCFELAAAQGCYYNNTQSSIDFWLLLGYAFY